MATEEITATDGQLAFAREWIRDVIPNVDLILGGWDDVADMSTEDVIRYVRVTYGGGWSQLVIDAQLDAYGK